ncbi:MAG: methyltransferase [Planctomycetota bacterium]|nr:MAG: methyltransferase [Planctomycetota bacterium]
MTLAFSDIRKQIDTLQIAERFFDSLLLFNLADLGVFAALAHGPRTLDELATATGGHAETLRAVLDAAVAVDLLQLPEPEAEPLRYAASPALLACLGDPESPTYLGEWMSFLGALVSPISQVAEAVRTGIPAGSMVDGSERDNRPARAMTRAMDAYARTRGVEIAQRLPLDGVRHLLDVGCGPGSYAMAFLDANPQLHATLLDLPGPIEIARGYVAERGLQARVSFAAADALQYTPERPVDMILVSNILHMLGPERSRALLARCFEMLQPGGRLVLQAEFLHADRRSPRWPTLLNLIMQATTEGGRNHSVDETSAWLAEAGFSDIEHQRLSPWNVNSVLLGWKRT